ncbi:MAG: hypothetical protein MUD17_04715 [Gemmatimonadaceae bacterium]|nr:hypothetical protein [Gemmatimonadaceae bacterium]
MVDEACVVAAALRVEHRVLVEDEEKRVVTSVAIIVATVGLLVRQGLTHIPDESLSLANRTRGEHAASLNA